MWDVPKSWRAIVAVADEGQFSRAAARLGMTQPQLSRLVAHAESRIGVTLFHRRPRATPTDAGEVVIRALRSAIDETTQAAAKATRIAHGQSGQITVGYASTVMASWVPASLQAFRLATPDVTITLRELHSSEQVQALREAAIDLAIGREPIDGPDMHSERLFEDELVAALASSHPLARTAQISLAAIAAEPFVLFERACAPGLHDLIVETCRSKGFELNVNYCAREWHTLLAFAASGHGVTIIPASLSALTWPNLCFRKLSGIAASAPTYLNFRPHGLSPAALGLVETILGSRAERSSARSTQTA
jgi:DNA-binding transcriptional LysR family regulator